jgi:hypothetical protein
VRSRPGGVLVKPGSLLNRDTSYVMDKNIHKCEIEQMLREIAIIVQDKMDY